MLYVSRFSLLLRRKIYLILGDGRINNSLITQLKFTQNFSICFINFT